MQAAPTRPASHGDVAAASPPLSAPRPVAPRLSAGPQRSSNLPIASTASDDAPWAPRSLGAAHWRHRNPHAAAADDSASASDGGDGVGFLPPHVYLSRKSAAGLGATAPASRRGSGSLLATAGSDPPVGSVHEGAGRKLTGAAAARFRVAVMRQTGFVEAADGGFGSQPTSPAAVPAGVSFDGL